MTRRLIKRNAHACTTLAGAWMLFSLFAIWDWREAHRHLGDPNIVFNFGIWGLELFFVFCAVYFSKTETPREVLWFGDGEGISSGFIRVDDVPSFLRQLALHVPGLTDTQIERIVPLANEAASQGAASITIPITYRGRAEQLAISFEVWQGSIIEVFVSTHLDLADAIDDILASYQEGIDAS